MSNYWYNNYFGSYLSISDIIRGGNLLSVLEMFYYQIFQPLDLLFFLDFILLILLVKGCKFYSFQDKRVVEKKLPLFLLLILLLFQVFLSNYILGWYSPYELYQMDSGGFANVYGLAPLYLYDLHQEVNSRKQDLVFREEINRPSLLQKEELNSNKLDKELNVIVIQVESLDRDIIDYKYNGLEITPFLNNLKEKSLYAENFYAQHLNGTFDADFSLLTSLYPVKKRYVFNENDMSSFNSLVRILKEKGYTTAALHGNQKTFFHRDQAFPDLGFDKFYGLSDYNRDKKEIVIRNEGMGINDYDFFAQSLDYLRELENPFFAYMITLSSHGPFIYYPDDSKREEIENINNQQVKDYFHSMFFVDRSLKMFYNELEKIGILDSSIIIIYGDHESGIKKEYAGESDMSNRVVDLIEHIPLIISFPGVVPEKIDRISSTPDIAPTVLDLIGSKEKPEDFAGNSLFNKKEKPIFFLYDRPLVFSGRQVFEQRGENFYWLESLDSELTENNSSYDVKLSREREETIKEFINYMRLIMQ